MKIMGVITRVSDGEIVNGKNAGKPWQQVTVEGIRMFVPEELQNGFCKGQRVRAEIMHRGDKKITDTTGKTLGYESDYELLTIEVVPEVAL